MGYYLLIGAGFTRNWDGPLSEEITGSLLGELHDDPEIVAALRKGPFEDAFQGFLPPKSTGPAAQQLIRFQTAVTDLFGRLNKTLIDRNFEFSEFVEFSVKRFLAKFDAIFSLNQDLLLEIHYIQTFISQGKWSGVVIPGMNLVPPTGHAGPTDMTMNIWRPTSDVGGGAGFQPFYKLHGSSNWQTNSGEPLLIMGNAKAGAIQKFSVLRNYHEQFSARLNEGNAKLMVVGYSFQDEHINAVIEQASREHGLGTYLVDPRGRNVLLDPKMARAAIRPKRDIEDIKLVGELRRPLAAVFRGDAFAHGELMRFFH
jgi:SIR2-like domain